ncbi:MAG: D-alanyl-D-alanine carboxypeptidase/D-alanyl-D-alanine-endopeptidase [Bacteroidetes bacterium]|nr:D-alanyl-D-alanine carboxypeptidase/D-alanyl-D-alanine-endopeptidase [Bacteroidota bacterium]
MKFFFLILTALLFLAGCSSEQSTKFDLSSPIGRLASDIAQRVDDPEFDNANWGVLIRSLKTGETVYSLNAKKMFMPASNMKLFTTSSAMTLLGPDYRFTTRLVTNGAVKDSVLNGNIIFVGSGDPTISGRFNNGKVTETFEKWADSLRLLGIREVNGNIIGDDNAFDEEYYGSGWQADDETDYYAAQIGAVMFNDNCVNIRVAQSAKIADVCSLSWTPNTRYVNIVNRTVTAPATDSVNTISFQRVRGTNTIIVTGKLSVGKKIIEELITVDNPTLYTMTVLKEVLESKGIRVTGVPLDVDDLKDSLRYDNAKHLASFVSVPYSMIAAETNKPSDNAYAEQTIRTVGNELLLLGSMVTGRRAAFPLLSSWGVDTVRLRMADGSGLSRMDLITPTDAVSLLTGMYNGPNFLPFYESLPLGGVDGTLKRRMKGTKAEGNVHAKTGTIGYVRGLSGYVTSADGEMFVFSMLVNHYTVSTRKSEKLQDDVCAMIAGFSRTNPK